ncbi:MAG: phospholipid carrier-dependent glycosyltransferase, partial [Alphaproteobacteria bacterium]|nr:phospholipid carrier-dependent glycosyltransferase [Alphaproteobacteria bacterium]
MTRLWRRLGGDGEQRRPTPAALALLVVLAVLTLGSGVATLPVMDRDEARYAQAAKQMLESGNLVDIRFQDDARLVKPAGVYWLQAASAAAFGGPDAPIAAYRLPSLVAAVAAVVLTAWFGARLFGAGVGLAAGLLLTTALVVQVEARTAKTDAVLLATILVAQVALARIALDRGRAFVGAPLVFWLAQGAGLMVKGPIITLVSGTTLLAWGLWQRDRDLVRRLRLGPGVAVMLAVLAPWIVLITLEHGWAFYQQALGRALLSKVAVGQESHGAPPGAHTLALALTFWPGTVLAALAAAAAWRGRGEPAVRFLLAWIVPTWVVFEAVATKLPHYTLPTFPAIAVLAALGLRDAGAILAVRGWRWLHRALAVVAVAVALALAAFPLAVTVVLGDAGAPLAPAVLAGGAGLALAVVVVRLARAPAPPRLPAVVLAGVAFYGLTFHLVLPRLDALWPSARVAERVAALEGCARIPVAVAGYAEPSNVFNLGTTTVLGTGG